MLTGQILMSEQEILTVSNGVLIVSSRCPTSAGNIHRNLKNDSIWVPTITLIKPTDKKLYFGGHFLEKEDLPAYTKNPNGNGGGLWYVYDENKQGLSITQYLFIPGEIENSEFLKTRIYNISNGFIPDSRDPIQDTEQVGIFAIDNDMGYTFTHESFGVNSRVEDVPRVLYNLLPGIENFGYDCKHSGSIGLSSNLHGHLNLDDEDVKWVVNLIDRDFKSKLEAKVLTQ